MFYDIFYIENLIFYKINKLKSLLYKFISNNFLFYRRTGICINIFGHMKIILENNKPK